MGAPTMNPNGSTPVARTHQVERAVTSTPGGKEQAYQGQVLRLMTSYPDPDTTVIHVSGEVDAATAPNVHELLEPRLASAVRQLVIDLSRVTFLGAAGVHLLAQAALRAEHQGINLQLVTGPRCVDRALRAGGMRVHSTDTASGGAQVGELQIATAAKLRSR